MTLAQRLSIVARQQLVAWDQDWQVKIVGLAFVLGIAAVPPSAHETISSYVGRGEQRGARWALVLAPLIDRLFVALGEAPGHCRRNVETAACGLAPTS